MRVIICENYEEMSNEAAKIVAGQIMLKPNCTLGLATGSTPVGMYKKLCEMNKNGEIDLQILGIGENGHIGFNEPSAKLNTKTHLTLLTESTINANSRFFTSADEVPHSALTMGIATILKSKKIILMASGAAKHCAVKAMLKETVDTDVPATVLNLHDDVVLSRKKVIRTPILRGGFSLSTSLKYSAIRQDYLRFFLAQSKIRSLKILRPEKNRILSRFWCGRCNKADALQR